MKKIVFLSICCLIFSNVQFVLGNGLSDRIAVEAGVKAEVIKDMAKLPEKASLQERICLDGRPVSGFQGEIIEYWADIECSFCGIIEPVKAQRDNPDICIVVRHIPSALYGDSLKKSLSFIALSHFSTNAANRFWDMANPKSAIGLPPSYKSALQDAMEEAAIDAEAFGDALQNAAKVLGEDIICANGRIQTTPTYIIKGIRFPACDFKSAQLIQARELAVKARLGEPKAQQEIVEVITRGLLNEELL